MVMQLLIQKMQDCAFQNTAIYHSDTLDFTSEPQVILKFEQSHRRFNGKHMLYSLLMQAIHGEVELISICLKIQIQPIQN